MRQSFQFLISIIVILGGVLFLVIIEYNELRSSYDLLEDEKVQVDEIINAFQERYSNEGVKEDLDSNGIPYRYIAITNYNSQVELLLGEDRVILRQIGTSDSDTICVVIDPHPKDVWDTCPSKW
ncbi:hypothetical protein [Nitrosopumilus sp.]|uniref:hypothetical protein n=1 Tax=Nitrosopumilus sp. TaxID=2024843 RepID=UPI003D0B60B4